MSALVRRQGGTNDALPAHWRHRLPNPARYYTQQIAKLSAPNGHGYATGLCPFHEDHTPSFGVKLTSERGLWRCYAGCGHGDLVAFHQQRMSLDFKAAVRDLLGLSP